MNFDLQQQPIARRLFYSIVLSVTAFCFVLMFRLYDVYTNNQNPYDDYTTQVSEDVRNKLSGSSILLFGDSLLAGYSEEEYDYLWSTKLNTICGMKTVQISTTGSTISAGLMDGYVFHGSFDSYVERELPKEEFDIVLVEGGMNDWLLNKPLGTASDSRDIYTIKGALNVVFDRLEQAYPNAIIVFMTGWSGDGRKNATELTTDVYNYAAEEVCKVRNIPCFCAYDTSVSGIYANEEVFREQFFLTSTDVWHLNEAGHARFLPVIASWLAEQLGDS